MTDKTKRLIKGFFLGVGILLVSSVLGGGYAIYNLKATAKNESFTIKNGCWQVNPKMDLSNPYQRALIALVGLFALRESEVLYFGASVDSDGDPLDANNNYILEGEAPDARYWSYTLYGADDFLVKNEADRFGFNLDNMQYVKRDTLNPEMPKTVEKNYQVTISNKEQGDNWLPSPGEGGPFQILLRMYNPSPAVYENLASVKLPRIKKVQ